MNSEMKREGMCSSSSSSSVSLMELGNVPFVLSSLSLSLFFPS